MSSNVSIQKFCEFCGHPFTAKTLVTRYCSKICNSRHYKQLVREDKLRVHNAKEIIENSPVEVLRNTSQKYYKLHEAAKIMRISKRTLYRLIQQKKIKKKKVLTRTVILKDDIKLFFSQQ